MNWVFAILVRLGLIKEHLNDDQVDPVIKEKLQEHSELVKALDVTADRRRLTNVKMRQVLVEARIRATPFSEVEHSLRSRKRKSHHVN